MRNETLSVREILRWAGCLVAAFATTAALATQDDWLIAFRAGGLLDLVLLVIFTILYRKALAALVGGRRRAVFALALGAGLALCMSTGRVLDLGYDLGNVPALFIGYLPLFIACFALLLTFLDGRDARPQKLDAKPKGRVAAAFYTLLDGSPKHTALVAGLAVLCWLPWLFIFYPGMVNDDVMTQSFQWFGNMDAHHPPLHTIAIAGSLRLGRALFGDAGAGLAVLSFLQMALQGTVFALVIRYMACIGLPFGWRLVTALYYVLFPTFGRYSITLVKDVWLGLFLLLLLVLMVDITRQRAAFFRSPKRVIALCVLTVLLLLSKNNAVYIFSIGVLCGVIALKGCRRQLLALLGLGIAFNFVITGPVYRALDIAPGPSAEMLSIPMQQIGRTVMVDARNNTIPQEERDIINEILPYDELPELYNYMISDPIKSSLNREAFAQNPGRYAAMWVRLGLRYPSAYVRAFLEQSLGYWYPDTSGGLYMTKTYYQFLHDLDWDTSRPLPAWDGLPRFITAQIGTERSLPGLGLLYKPGFNFWVLLFCGAWALYKKRYADLVPLGFLLGVWLTCVASPLYAEFRYAWPAIVCVPFFVAYIFGRKTGAGEATKPQ